MITLRPYQEVGVDRLRKSIMAGKKSPLLVAPTGAGKTRMFSFLASQLVTRKRRVALLCHREELIEQICGALGDVRVQYGIISAHSSYYDRRLLAHVASVFTLVRRLDRVEIPDFVIIDEAHHCVAGTTWGKVIAYWREKNPELIVIGVTATPERLSGEGLGEVFDDLVVLSSTAELIDEGWLSTYRLFAPRPSHAIDFSDVGSIGGDFKRDQVAAKMDKPTITGNAVAEYVKHCNGAPAVAFCSSVAHADHVAETFRASGFRSQTIDAKMEKRDRRQLVQDFRDGKINVLTSCDIISEGFDIPGIVGAILLRPTQSLAVYMQQVGRALRISPGKEHAVILDQVNNWQRHGLPDDAREWSLEARKRKKKGAVDPDDIGVKQCPKCYTVSRSTAVKCINAPECTHVFVVKSRKITEVAGELGEIDVEAQRIARQMETRAQGQAQTLSALMTEVGMSMGRAQHVLEARAEKQRLQSVVAEAVMDLKKATGRMEYTPFAIKRMKPKELKETYALCHARIHEAALSENTVEAI